MDFYEILYSGTYIKLVDTFQFWFPGKMNGWLHEYLHTFRCPFLPFTRRMFIGTKKKCFVQYVIKIKQACIQFFPHSCFRDTLNKRECCVDDTH